ncbi:hypothetical protein F5Y00DRAFT_55167 [Daldinia vernicosa]|uniref:uncharacterized protein n=1 Tax=Daldinia vernicosa TaxID=114800 RepID=UPI00200775D6|nr:uncharacterized protein F5Y00DRAFT_55167 [Daldinia vernicosa]KAI0849624.1 hypothetical protein F5Y00DRAFT_55167 [Daldinia vernicosa]
MPRFFARPLCIVRLNIFLLKPLSGPGQGASLARAANRTSSNSTAYLGLYRNPRRTGRKRQVSLIETYLPSR